jgi:hypothetical protein
MKVKVGDLVIDCVGGNPFLGIYLGIVRGRAVVQWITDPWIERTTEFAVKRWRKNLLEKRWENKPLQRGQK